MLSMSTQADRQTTPPLVDGANGMIRPTAGARVPVRYPGNCLLPDGYSGNKIFNLI